MKLFIVKVVDSKKVLFLLTTLPIFLILVSSVVAQRPQLSISSDQIDLFNGDEQSVDLTIKNTGERSDNFAISVFPSYWNKLSTFPDSSLVTLAAGDSTTVKVYFSALAESEFGVNSFTITVTPTSDRTSSSNVTLQVRILRRSPVFVLDLVTDKFGYNPEETAAINTTISNVGNVKSEAYALETVVARDSEAVKRFRHLLEDIPARSKTAVTDQIDFEKFTKPGTYKVSSVMRNELGFIVSSKSANFKINEVVKVSQLEKTVGMEVLAAKTDIKANNAGNVPTPIVITADVPSFADGLFVPLSAPSSREVKAGVVVYSWKFDNVAPGGEVSVSYKYALWQVWFVLFLLAVAVYFAFKYVFTLKAVKSYSHRGSFSKDKEILITVDLRNRSMYEAKDIIVRDFIPSILKIVTRFDTVKPSIKESAAGTELVWKFDSLRPGEDRVLTYRIKPVVDITGSIQLPSVDVRYVDNKRRRKFFSSGEISIREK